MKLILENWNKFLNEGSFETPEDEEQVVQDAKKVVDSPEGEEMLQQALEDPETREKLEKLAAMLPPELTSELTEAFIGGVPDPYAPGAPVNPRLQKRLDAEREARSERESEWAKPTRDPDTDKIRKVSDYLGAAGLGGLVGSLLPAAPMMGVATAAGLAGSVGIGAGIGLLLLYLGTRTKRGGAHPLKEEELLKEARDPVGPGPSAGELMGRARENFPPDVLARAGYGEEEPVASADPETERELDIFPLIHRLAVDDETGDALPEHEKAELSQEVYNLIKDRVRDYFGSEGDY